MRLTTAKAYAAATMTAVGALLTATTPFLSGNAGRWAYAVLAVLAALGVTYRVPNADPDAAAADHAKPGVVGSVLDVVPAVLGGALGAVKQATGGDDAGPTEPETFD